MLNQVRRTLGEKNGYLHAYTLRTCSITRSTGRIRTGKIESTGNLEQIENEWRREVEEAPDPAFRLDREEMVLPMERLQILSEWIGKLDEQTVQLEDMDEEVSKDRTPKIKSEGEAYNLANYTLKPEEREDLRLLIEGYNQGVTKLLAFIKPKYEEWENKYQEEPSECPDEDAGDEIVRRLDLIEQWMGDIEPIDRPDIKDLDEYVD
jgi:hypothetical protein